ncbi:hypothetical protein [Streptomyces flavidovirens]|uniref:hypothetical protein n=1 Tax=Streptomyces flavidovirens TaxID=67298 RepID=UPI0003FD4D59|nr:hypothetical protein [Streptomyces flavidovirens]
MKLDELNGLDGFGERDLSRAMENAVAGVRSPGPALVEGATRYGRKVRRRRRIAAGLGVCAVTGVMAGMSLFGAYLPSYTGSVEQALPAAPGGGTAKVVIPDFSRQPMSPSPPAGKERLTGRATVQTLKELLPGEPGTSGYMGQGTPPEAYETFGRLSVDGPLAGSEVQVNVQPGFGRDMSAQKGEKLADFYSCEHREPDGSMASCGTVNLADGSVLMVYEDRSGLLVRRHADLLRPDGTRIVAGTANGKDVADGPVLGLEPPLTLGELRTIVTSPRWSVFVDPAVNERAKELKPYDDRS